MYDHLFYLGKRTDGGWMKLMLVLESSSRIRCRALLSGFNLLNPSKSVDR